MTSEKVCIIGAGSSGIVAAKIFKENNIPFDCFEKGSAIGGNWRFNNDNGLSSSYRTLHIISSKWNMRYSDFPMPDEFPDYGHHSDVLRYFENYVDHFGIREHITFRTEVKEVRPHDEHWQVSLSNNTTHRYRAVVVANGHHWKPKYPDFPGNFSGKILHSHHYKTPEDYTGKRVLIVGIGNSACDIAIDLCRLAKQVVVSTRRSAYVIPKYLLGIPTDQWTHPVLERLVPLSLRRKFFKLLVYLTVGNQERYGLPRPQHKLLQEHPTLNQEFLSYVGHGRIKIKPNIQKLSGDNVEFVDGTKMPFDVIIYATGYQIAFPFIPKEILDVKDNRVHFYRHVIPVDLPNIYFLGLLQPLGAIMPLAEQQAKWIAGLLKGSITLPGRETMLKEIRKTQHEIEKRYINSPRHTIQVDFWDYFYTIEKEMKRYRNPYFRKTNEKRLGDKAAT
jgi:hypothetical protein